jgi:hypothetical protein
MAIVVPTCGAVTLPVNVPHMAYMDATGVLCTAAGSSTTNSSGSSTGSVTAAGASGTVAQAIQGITGGVPANVTVVNPTVSGSQEQDVRGTATLNTGTLNASIVVPVNGQGVVGFTFAGLTGSGATLTYEQSIDGNQTWTGVNEVNAGTGVPSGTRTTDGQVRVGAGGRTGLRVRVSTAGSTTVTVTWNVSVRESIVLLGTPLPPGSNYVGQVGAGRYTAALPTYAEGGYASLLTDVNGRLVLSPSSAIGVSGTVTSNQGTTPWTVGGTVTANQGTSPWVVSGTSTVTGTVTSNQGTSPWVVSGTSTTSGNAANASADSGNPVKVGCVYNSTAPTYTAGQRSDCQSSVKGSVGVYVADPTTGAGLAASAPTADAVTAGVSSGSLGYSHLYNGATWDRQRSANAGSGTPGTGIAAMAILPTTANVGIVPATSSATSFVFKASAGNLYGYSFTQGTTAGYLVVLNTATAPAAGAAISGIECIPVGASTRFERTNPGIPDRYTAGITFVSSTSCTTFTANTPIVMKANVQ